LLTVLLMAGKAAHSLMYTDRRTVVSRIHLHGRPRCVTLITESLPRIRADLYQPWAVVEGGQWEALERHMRKLPPVEKGQRRAVDFLRRPRVLWLDNGLLEGKSLAVDLMARETRNGRLGYERGIFQTPRAFLVHWLDKISDRTFEIHSVATEAVIHRHLFLVMVFVEKDLRVGYAMGTCGPFRKFLLVTLSASADHPQNVLISEADLLGHLPAEMSHNPSHVIDVESGFECKHTPVAL